MGKERAKSFNLVKEFHTKRPGPEMLCSGGATSCRASAGCWRRVDSQRLQRPVLPVLAPCTGHVLISALMVPAVRPLMGHTLAAVTFLPPWRSWMLPHWTNLLGPSRHGVPRCPGKPEKIVLLGLRSSTVFMGFFEGVSYLRNC